MIELGWKAQHVSVVLEAGTDWIVSITPKQGAPEPDYPVGTEVDAIFYPTNTNVDLPLSEWPAALDTWSATVSTDEVSWHVDHVDADVIPNRAVVRIEIRYPGPPEAVFTWMQGRVER